MNPELVITKSGVRQAGTTDSGEMIAKLKRRAQRSLYVFNKAILGWDRLVKHLHGSICRFLQAVEPVGGIIRLDEHDYRITHRRGVLIPRDCFKTTIAKGLVMHMTIQDEETNCYLPGIYGPDTRILYCCETADRAETRLRYMRDAYEQNQLLRAFWPEKVWDNTTQVKAKWNQTRLLLPRKNNYDECTIERTGIDAAITGGHFDAFVKDDLIGLAAHNEPTTMMSAIKWNDASASLFNDPLTVLEWYFGTRWGAFDLYTQVQDSDPDVEWYIRSIIEDGKLLFPERITEHEIQRLMRKDEDLFYLNYMNSTVGSKMQDFDMSLVRGFEMAGEEVLFEELEGDRDLMQLFTLAPPKPGSKLTPEALQWMKQHGIELKFS